MSQKSLIAALALLSQTAWDAALAAVLPQRDALYALLGVAMPASRSGADAAVFAGTSPQVGGHTAEAAWAAPAQTPASDYGDFVREAGI